MDNQDLYDIIEHTIDYAFNGKYMLNMYDYLVLSKSSKKDVEEFLESSSRKEIDELISDLDNYLEGGSDEKHKQLREGYGYLGKPEARKIRNYLNGIVEDAVKYGREKRPGRKRKPSK
jgi:hypothetical protein